MRSVVTAFLQFIDADTWPQHSRCRVALRVDTDSRLTTGDVRGSPDAGKEGKIYR